MHEFDINFNRVLPVWRPIFISFVAVLILFPASPSNAASPETDAAVKTWDDCVMRAVSRLDDGKSDAVSIAYGVEPVCAAEYEQYTQTMLQGYGPSVQLAVRPTAEAAELKRITTAVLAHRASQNQSASTGDPIARELVDATSAYKHGDYATAMRLFRLLADESNSSVQPAAELMVGHMYDNGYGVQRDAAEAAKWFRKAANQGNAIAQLQLGLAYHYGWGVARNYGEAVKWYQMAADQGDAHAQSYLGQSYKDGEGVSQDYSEAAKWLRKASDQGNAMAQNLLGSLYMGGKGVPQDDVQAYMWYELSIRSTAGVQVSDLEYDLNDAIKRTATGVLNFLATQMPPAEIDEARQLAANWQPSHSGEPRPGNSSMTALGSGGSPIAATSGVNELAPVQNTTCTKQDVEFARWAKQNGYQHSSTCQ